MKEWLINHLWLIVGGVALFLIVVLEITSWRPLGYASKHEEINRIILTISYSFFASCLFYLFNDLIPSYRRRIVAKKYIEKELFIIKESFRQLVNIKPFSFSEKAFSMEEFAKEFANNDLFKNADFNEFKTKIQILTERKQYIEQICKNLLSSYSLYMNHKQIEFIIVVLRSRFIVEPINAKDFNIPQEILATYPNNQEEIGRSIFELYILSKNI